MLERHLKSENPSHHFSEDRILFHRRELSLQGTEGSHVRNPLEFSAYLGSRGKKDKDWKRTSS